MQVDSVKDISPFVADLNEILVETVAAGASIGFLPPVAPERADAYWQFVQNAVYSGERLIFIAHEEGRAYGVVQLRLTQKGNGVHRGEVEKLMVHPNSRGHGIGHKLMVALEHKAWEIGRTLILLDTRRGDVADGLYGRLGYTRFGIVPAFTIDSDGTKHDTCFFYKQLSPSK